MQRAKDAKHFYFCCVNHGRRLIGGSSGPIQNSNKMAASRNKEPEVHLIGQITGASSFESDNAFCQFEVKAGTAWTCLGGDVEGQTQVDYRDQVSGNVDLLCFFTFSIINILFYIM